MIQHPVGGISDLRRWRQLAVGEVMQRVAEDPGVTLSSAADHDTTGARGFQYPFGFLRGIDIPVGQYGNTHCCDYTGHGLVFGVAVETAGAGAAMDGKCLNSCVFRNACDGQGIAFVGAPACADFQSHRHVHCLHHGVQNICHQGFVTQQRGAGRLAADFLRRATHVDVDDLCTEVYVGACGLCQHIRVGTGNLHRDRAGFVGMGQPRTALARVPQARIGGHHFGHDQPRPQVTAELPERAIRDTGHGGQHQRIGEIVGTDLHGTSGAGCRQQWGLPRRGAHDSAEGTRGEG